jgi:hypothetical protein
MRPERSQFPLPTSILLSEGGRKEGKKEGKKEKEEGREKGRKGFNLVNIFFSGEL